MDLSKLSDDELRAIVAQAKQPKGDAPIDPTADMPWWEQGLAGIGKAFVDTGRGVGQLVGAVSREDVDAAKKRDAPLMDRGWGMAGNIAGNVIPALAMPSSTIPKALAYGAGLGFTQPVGTQDSRAENTILGGALNAALPVAGALYRGGRALVEPVLAPKRTAARVLEQFADDPQAMRLAAGGAQELVPGSKPTLAQVVQQPGISSLERGAMNQPGPLQQGLTERALEQNAARKAAIDDLSGADGRLDFNKANRDETAQMLYAKAFAEAPEDSKWIKGEVNKLMKRPAFVDALKDAQELALNQGIKVSPKNPENATQLLHFTKMGLDDQIERSMTTLGKPTNQTRALIDTRDSLVSLMESKGFSPSYREARDTYKQMSQPINEMELAGQMGQKLIPSLEAVTGQQAPARLLANNFASDVRRRSGDIDRAFSPEGKAKLDGLLQDLQRKASAEGLGKATGSPTAQYLTTQNLMRQVMGPMGLPAGLADKAAGMVMGTPGVGGAAQWLMKGPEHRVQRELADLLLDPSQASQAFAQINRAPNPWQRRLGQAAPYLPAIATTGMFSYGH